MSAGKNAPLTTELESFWAVTETSVYHVIAKGENGRPFAEKMAIRGESAFPLGHKIGGEMFAITKNLQTFFPDKIGVRKIEMVNNRFWGPHTSPIIALFLSKQEALNCFNYTDSKPCDKRWLKQTKAVLTAIGDEHPTISICHYSDLSLCC